MKTYFNRIRTLNNRFQPAHMGWSSKEEIELIREVLELDSMNTELELRNMRDMVVMVGSLNNYRIEEEYGDGGWDKAVESMDRVTAITAVIDNELWKRGYEV